MSEEHSKEAPPPTYPVVGQFPPPRAGPAPQHSPPVASDSAPPPRFVPYRPPPTAEEEKQQLALRYRQQEEEEQQQQQQHQGQSHGEFPPPPGPPPEQHEPPPQYEILSPSAPEQHSPQQEDLPPPPPHPPKHFEYLDQQGTPHPDFPPPPPQNQDDHHQDGEEQQEPPQGQFPPPQGEPVHSPVKEEQYYPPPPPLPHPQSPSQGHQENDERQHEYSIPSYDPANPVFAPPTAPLQAEHHGQSGHPGHQQIQEGQHPPPGYQHHEQHPSPSSGQGHHGGSGLHDRPKHSWSERFSQFGIKAAGPINNIAHKLGSQSFLPETLDKECDKAATILRAFCKKGVYAEPDPSDRANAPEAEVKPANMKNEAGDPARARSKDRVIITIPPKVISKAVGLAIFTTLRAGYGLSGATGSGVLVARLPDGSWSPPSGIQLHSVGGGFQIGLDIYDCVCVINSQKALEAFTDTRVSLGSDLAVVAGPYGAGAAVEVGASMPDLDTKSGKKGGTRPLKTGALVGAERPQEEEKQQQQQQQPQQPQQETHHLQSPNESQEAKKKDPRRGVPPSAIKPVFSYVKSRGLYAGISVDGTVVAERKEANAAFYGQTISVQQILKGQVPPHGPAGMWPAGAQGLLAVLKGAEAGAAQPKQQQQEREEEEEEDSGAAVERDNNEQGAPPPYADNGRHSIKPDVKYK